MDQAGTFVKQNTSSATPNDDTRCNARTAVPFLFPVPNLATFLLLIMMLPLPKMASHFDDTKTLSQSSCTLPLQAELAHPTLEG